MKDYWPTIQKLNRQEKMYDKQTEWTATIGIGIMLATLIFGIINVL